MRILQICAAYKPAFIYGGPTMSVTMLSEQLSAAGVYIEVYATTANGSEELPVIPGESINVDGVMVTYFKRLTGDHTHFSPALLGRLWREVKKFDAVHIHAWWNTVSVLSCAIALIRGKRVILSPRGTLSAYTFHNKNTTVKKLLHEILGKPLLRRCYFHVTSGQESEAIKKIVTPPSIVTIPNFVLLPKKGSGRSHMSNNVFRLAFFSRIEQKKGLDLLIDALPFLNVSYRLSVAGSGDNGYIYELKNKAQLNGVAANIIWTGFLHKEKFAFLANQDLIILPSHDENFANVVIEALSEGTPVLLSKSVGLADYVTEKKLGWLCDVHPRAIAERIDAICNAPDELTRIQAAAPELVRADFSIDKLIHLYIAMYEQVLNPK